MNLSKSKIPKDIIGTAMIYFRYKAMKSDKFDGKDQFHFSSLGEKDYRWDLLRNIYTPIWKWLLYLRTNNLQCIKENIKKFNEQMIEFEGRTIGTVQQWQAVIAMFIEDLGNGFQSKVVREINEKAGSGTNGTSLPDQEGTLIARDEIEERANSIPGAPYSIERQDEGESEQARGGIINSEQNEDIPPGPPSKGGIIGSGEITTMIDVKPLLKKLSGKELWIGLKE